MRIGLVDRGERTGWAIERGDEAALLPYETFTELAAAWAAGELGRDTEPCAPAWSPEPLLRPRKILGVGFNYLDHAAETGSSPPSHPVLFGKLPEVVVGDGAAIRIDAGTTSFADWEAELAVILGRRAHSVPIEAALDHVLGYTAANDVSARDIQAADEQWFRAKNLPTFCPLGPRIVTAEEVGDPQGLAIGSRVNGEPMQEASTADMRFGVAELLSFCSRHFVLEPGDVLLTGTPAGIGMSRNPQRRLADGDVVEVEIERIGILRNPVEEVDPVVVSV
jgi:5-carboxymethyl-2-hydroxymuconate isomerase